MPRKIKITDKRKENSWGAPVTKGRSGDYNEEIIHHIATAAMRMGVDPYTALAVGLQESGLGTYHSSSAQENFGQVRWDKWNKDPGLKKAYDKHPDLLQSAVALNYVLKKSLDSDKDEARAIQGYNGYLLKPDNDIGGSNMYGIDLKKYPKGYDLKADPRYGKAVIDLRDNVLKQSPDVVGFVNSLKYPQPPLQERLQQLFYASK